MDRFLDRVTARIAFDVEGPATGRALIAGHETTSSRAQDAAWGLIDWAAVPSAGMRLVRYDARGHGASSGGGGPEDFRWPSLAADVLALADTVSPDEPVDLLGVAGGCGPVLWAAATAPHRIARLVLVAPLPVGPARERQVELYRAAAELAEVRGIEAWARASAAMPPVPLLHAAGLQRIHRPAVPESVLPAVVRGDADSTLPPAEVLAALEHEVLVLAWPGDPSHPVDGAAWLAELIPAGRLEVAEDVAALSGWGARIAAFLTGGGPGGGRA